MWFLCLVLFPLIGYLYIKTFDVKRTDVRSIGILFRLLKILLSSQETLALLETQRKKLSAVFDEIGEKEYGKDRILLRTKVLGDSGEILSSKTRNKVEVRGYEGAYDWTVESKQGGHR